MGTDEERDLAHFRVFRVFRGSKEKKGMTTEYTEHTEQKQKDHGEREKSFYPQISRFHRFAERGSRGYENKPLSYSLSVYIRVIRG